jgi:protein tyrosine/serine phosphatase
VNCSRRRGLALGAAALAVVAAGVVAWAELRYEFLPKRWVEVEPSQLYRSGQLSRRLVRDVLERNGIRVVVDLNADRPGSNPDAQAEDRAVEELGIEYHLFPLRGDGSGDVRSYARAIAAIERARRQAKPTLVHCSAGARRTGGVIAAYQVLVRGVPVEAAYRELDRYGATPVSETPLVDWLDRNMAGLAELLKEMGVIDRIPDPLPSFGPS